MPDSSEDECNATSDNSTAVTGKHSIKNVNQLQAAINTLTGMSAYKLTGSALQAASKEATAGLTAKGAKAVALMKAKKSKVSS